MLEQSKYPSRWMDKQNTVYPHDETLLINKEQAISNHNTEEFQTTTLNWNKQKNFIILM